MGLVRSMTSEVIKEIGNKSREFYEFVLPPVDMQIENDKITVTIDLPGFDKKDVKLVLNGNILSINAEKPKIQKSEEIMIVCNQRPSVIDKKIRLPIDIKEGQEKVESAKFSQGVLTLVIPFSKSGKGITIE